jgi:peptide/nickel transport system substrate-binding protein
MEGLLTVGPRGEPEPLLATSWTNPNPQTFVFHLRHGVKFWDGATMTSADVVNALNYYRKPTSLVYQSYKNITGVKATGLYTVVVTMKHRDASFLPSLSWESNIFEKAFQQKHGAKMGDPGVLIMGTGPFEVNSFDPTTGLTFSANPDWWGGKVPVQKLDVKFFADQTSEALAFRAGQIDVAFPGSSQAWNSTAGSPVRASGPAVEEGYFAMNVHIAPWSNIHVRRAVAYALDRAAIMKALGNASVPATTFISPFELRTIGSQAQVDAIVKSVPGYPYSVAKAKAELAKSPYPHGFTASVPSPAFQWYAQVNQVIAADLARIGIRLKLENMTFNKFLAIGTGPKTFGATYVDFNLVSPDPSSYPAWLLGKSNISHGGWNLANYSPPQVDTLISQGLTTLAPAGRLKVYARLLRILGNDEPYVPLYVGDYNLALAHRFKMLHGLSVAYTRLYPFEFQIAPN